MRERKYRVWNTQFDEPKMLYSDENSNLDIFFEYNPTNNLMDWTTLRDKNGREIYEGDILNLSKDSEPKNIYFVEYKNDRFWLSQYTGKFDGYDLNSFNDFYYRICLSAYCKDSVVIGNIWENPELLK
jgi:uncharacterized phage protein (TIGR01671 family)